MPAGIAPEGKTQKTITCQIEEGCKLADNPQRKLVAKETEDG